MHEIAKLLDESPVTDGFELEQTDEQDYVWRKSDKACIYVYNRNDDSGWRLSVSAYGVTRVYLGEVTVSEIEYAVAYAIYSIQAEDDEEHEIDEMIEQVNQHQEMNEWKSEKKNRDEARWTKDNLLIILTRVFDGDSYMVTSYVNPTKDKIRSGTSYIVFNSPTKEGATRDVAQMTREIQDKMKRENNPNTSSNVC